MRLHRIVIARQFDEAFLAAGKAPDMSPVDAAVNPHLERSVEDAAATSKAQIRKAVAKAWAKVTPEICKRAVIRVRRNMKQVIKLKGGNFYQER